MAAEAPAAAPLGLLVGRRGAALGVVLAAGGVLGAIIKFALFFLVLGVSQGFTVLTRAVASWAGAMAWQRRERLAQIGL